VPGVIVAPDRFGQALVEIDRVPRTGQIHLRAVERVITCEPNTASAMLDQRVACDRAMSR
jgi:hypothetical protein